MPDMDDLRYDAAVENWLNRAGQRNDEPEDEEESDDDDSDLYLDEDLEDDPDDPIDLDEFEIETNRLAYDPEKDIS